MRFVILAPDSFKGTLSASEVCGILREAFLGATPDAQISSIPVADGGEGTVEAFLTACGGQRRTVRVTGPLWKPVEAAFAILPDNTAVIEMAAASGLPLVGNQKNPWETTTYGTGELLRAALDAGCTRVLLGLGGSATNDGGIGCAAALGVRFLGRAGEDIPLTGGGLGTLDRIDVSGLDRRIRPGTVTALCDVRNLFYGPQGASVVFAPQKGADAQMVYALDRNLNSLSDCIRRDLGCDIASLPGAGAAGGLGGGLVAFLGARLRPGVDVVLDTAGFDGLAARGSLIVTGEGKLDSQSRYGKVIAGVTRRAGGCPVIAVAGQVELSRAAWSALGLRAVYEANDRHLPFEQVILSCREDLARAARRAAADFAAGSFYERTN